MNKISRELKSNISVVTIEKIKATEVYKNLPKFKQIFATKLRNDIHHGVIVSQNIGLDKWLSQNDKPHYVNEIVKELVGA